MSIVYGNEADLTSCIDMLKEVKEAILNAYEMKTGSQRAKLSQFMTNETWISAKKAVEWGFADGILYKEEKQAEENGNAFSNFAFNSRAYTLAVVNKLKSSFPKAKVIEPPVEPGTPHIQLEKRLNLIK
jgi:ATP-dependent Clp protease protease subunit